MSVTFNAGDRVAFRAAFLRAIGDYTYVSAQRRGTVIIGSSEPLLSVHWDGEPMSRLVNRATLILADRIHLELA